MKTLLPLILLLSGCGFSYQFDPRSKLDSVNKEGIVKAFNQQHESIKALADLAVKMDARLKALEPKKEEKK